MKSTPLIGPVVLNGVTEGVRKKQSKSHPKTIATRMIGCTHQEETKTQSILGPKIMWAILLGRI